MACPVIVCCFEGVDAIEAVRVLTGPTNGRKAAPGTIRGDYSMSFQENIVHASDSPEAAEAELKRFLNQKKYLTINRLHSTSCMLMTSISEEKENKFAINYADVVRKMSTTAFKFN